MTQKVEFQIAADDTSAKAAWERQQNAINAVIGRIGQMEDKLASAQKQQANMFSGAVSGAAQMVTGLVSVQGALGLISKEYDAIKQRQDRALQTQTTLAAVQRQAVLNLGVDPNWNAAKLTDTITAMSKRVGVDEKLLTQTASEALSARGDLSVEKTLASVETAARLMPDAPDSLPVLSASAMDLSKGSGASPESAIGFLQSVGAASRVTSLKSLAENVAPGILGVSKFGGTERESGAILAAISGAMVDTTGAQTKTSGISFAKQLEKFVPTEDTTLERIRFLQQNQSKAAEFLKSGSFESAFVPVARGLLSGDANTAERRGLDAALGQIVDIKGGSDLFSKTLTDINDLPTVQNARKAQEIAAATDRLKAANFGGASASVGRDAVIKMTDETGGGWIRQWVAGMSYDMRTELLKQTPDQAAATLMEQRAAALERPTLAPMGPGGVPMVGPAAETEASKALRDAAATMRETSKELRRVADRPVKVEKPHVPRTPVSAAAGTGGK